MPASKKEGIFFTILVCFLMVLGMSIYNLMLHHNLSFVSLITGFFPGFIIALILDTLIVGRLAKSFVKKLPVDPTKPLAMILAISSSMVVGMVICMSFYGTIVSYGFHEGMLEAYGKAILQNFVAALPLQLLIVGPVARKLLLTVRHTGLLANND